MSETALKLAILEEKFSQLELPISPDKLYTPIRYIMEDGGKRMRPLLLILAGELYGKGNQDEIIAAAIGIEVFHNFTLLHDDIMDSAPIRRGRPTVHIKWSDNVAILSGDAMVILAYRLMSQGISRDKIGEVLNIFNKAAMEVCEGQQWDMDFEAMECVALEQYIDMIRLKTSVLMAAALEIGAYIGGANEKERQAIYNFGVNLGLAFQIQDDLLDTYGDSSTFGKTIGGDISVGKKTFLYITAMGRAHFDDRVILKNSRDYNEIRALYDNFGVKTVAQKAVQHYFDEAMRALKGCSSNKARLKPLEDYALELLNRIK